MRIRLGLAGILLGGATAGLLLGVGCGGSESTPDVDAGSDATSHADVVADTAVDDASTCTVDAADLNSLDVPDAALADGGSSVGLCLACGRASCGQQMTSCNASCECREAVFGFYKCISNGGSLQGCALQLGTGTGGKAATSLGFCVYQNCSDECGIPNLDGGLDDAPADAPNDG